MNRGAKLDLGSTAKLRTLITYLEIVAELHERFAGQPAGELKVSAAGAADPLTQWAADRLAASAERSLPALLDCGHGTALFGEPLAGLLHRRRPAGSRTSTPSTTARASALPRRSAARSTSCSSG